MKPLGALPGIALWAAVSIARAALEAPVPTEDKKGSKDSSVLQRYEGSFIVAYEHQEFGELTLPLSRLEPVPGRKDGHNNRVHEPKEKKTVEGEYTRLVYLIPQNRSPLEVLRNYQEEVQAKGGRSSTSAVPPNAAGTRAGAATVAGAP
jgi:hypothetical protein